MSAALSLIESARAQLAEAARLLSASPPVPGQPSVPGTPSPPPVNPTPPPAPGLGNILPICHGGWTESRSPDILRTLRPPYINAVRTTNLYQPEALNVIILHELYDPFRGNYQMKEVDRLIDQAAAAGFQKVLAYDMEGKGWHTRGWLRQVSARVRGRGWKIAIAPKVSLDLSGRYMAEAPTYNGTRQILIQNADELWIWFYGNDAAHMSGAEGLIKGGYPNAKIRHIHDTFRNQANGYQGHIFGERTFQRAAALGRGSLSFQPWGNASPDVLRRVNALYDRFR